MLVNTLSYFIDDVFDSTFHAYILDSWKIYAKI